MPTNSLGFRTEAVNLPVGAAVQARSVDIEIAQASAPTVAPMWCGMSRQGMACCTLTLLLIASGIGIGTWYLVAEM